MRIRVYIDGFNLYYGVVKRNASHWLDLAEFSRRLGKVPAVDKIIFCTAMVSATPNDPGKAIRQYAYHQAIKAACPNVEILLGQFKKNKKLQPLAVCKQSPSCAIRVSVRTEKGSDVNLAARLIHDAHTDKFDRAIVVSGDSDLVEPIRLVVQEVGLPVWVRNPRHVRSSELSKVATSYDWIRPKLLGKSLLPDPVIDNEKQFPMPLLWKSKSPSTTKEIVSSHSCTVSGCGKISEVVRYI